MHAIVNADTRCHFATFVEHIVAADEVPLEIEAAFFESSGGKYGHVGSFLTCDSSYGTDLNRSVVLIDSVFACETAHLCGIDYVVEHVRFFGEAGEHVVEYFLGALTDYEYSVEGRIYESRGALVDKAFAHLEMYP